VGLKAIYKDRERIVILSLFGLVIFTAVISIVFLELLAKHLIPFLYLSLTCRAALALVVSPFFAGGFPAFELPSHMI
jgi:hypothetical protein